MSKHPSEPGGLSQKLQGGDDSKKPSTGKGNKMAFSDSLASKLKMPMAAGGAQGAKKTVDEELDDQFGGSDDTDGGAGPDAAGGKKSKYDPAMTLGKASKEQLQAALDVKSRSEKQKPGSKDISDDDEASDDDAGEDDEPGEGGEPDDGSRPTY